MAPVPATDPCPAGAVQQRRDGKPFTETFYTYDTKLPPGLSHPLSRVAVVSSTSEAVYEGDCETKPSWTQTRYTTDAHGRVIRTDQDGRLDLDGDETLSLTTYTAAIETDALWLRPAVCEQQLLEPATGAVET